MSDELLPCPFCGGTANLEYNQGNEVWPQKWWCQCMKCGLTLAAQCGTSTWEQRSKSKKAADDKAKGDAIANWNRRAPVDASPASGGDDKAMREAFCGKHADENYEQMLRIVAAANYQGFRTGDMLREISDYLRDQRLTRPAAQADAEDAARRNARRALAYFEFPLDAICMHCGMRRIEHVRGRDCIDTGAATTFQGSEEDANEVVDAARQEPKT